jgi:hypothetical protein
VEVEAVALDSRTDAELGGPIVLELREEFKSDMLTLREFARPALPTSLTPRDLDALYHSQEYIAAWLWTASNIVSKWQRVHNEVAALHSKRKEADTSARFAYIVKNSDADEIKPLKSEAQKLIAAGDLLDLDGFAGLAYLADLVKGWHIQTLSFYTRLEKQLDTLISHLAILRSQIALTGKLGT